MVRRGGINRIKCYRETNIDMVRVMSIGYGHIEVSDGFFKVVLVE